MQRAHLMAMHERQARRWWIGVAAAAVLLLAVGAWWLVAGGATLLDPTSAPTLRVTLDLRPYSVTRSPTAPDAPPPLELPRGVVDLTILLPVGSEPGLYDVQVLDAERRPLAAVQGDAAIRDFITTLRVSLDLRELPAENYRFATRRAGDDWRTHPVTVR